MDRNLTPRRAFALQRLVLGVLVFAVMVAIGIPLRARSARNNDRASVSDALMKVVVAREHYALDHDVPQGTTVTLEQLLADGRHLDGLPPALLEREVRLGPVGGRVAAKLDGEWFDPLPTPTPQSDPQPGVVPPSQIP